jgi:DNA-binding response OmpR family regulator
LGDNSRCGGRRRHDGWVMSLLLIEDDDSLSLSLAMALEDEGYEVASFPTAELGLEGFAIRPHEMVLVDLMLPGISGFDCIRELRKRSDVPIVVVSAREEWLLRS